MQESTSLPGHGAMGADIAADETARALRESEERLRVALDAAGQGAWFYEPDSGRMDWDERSRQLWGLAADDPVDYAVFMAGIHPDDRARVQAAVEAAADPAGSRRYQVEYRVLDRRDGRVRWIGATGRVRFEQGRAVQSIGTVQDISPRKAAEEALRASEELLASVYAGIEAAITVCEVLDGGMAFRFVSANRACAAWSGIAAERWQGRSPHELLPPADADAVVAHYRQAVREGRPVEYEECLNFPTGEVWTLTTVSPLRDGSGAVTRLLATSIDLTRRKRVERELRRSEAIHRRLVEADLFGVGFGTSSGGVQFVNDEMLRMMGRSRADYEAGRIDWFAAVAPEFRPAMAEQAQRVLREGRAAGYESAFLRPDGGRTPYVGSAALLQPGEDFHVSIALDLSKVRQAEQALRDNEARERERAQLLQTVLDTSPMPIWITLDRECQRIVGNPAGAALLGAPRDANVSLSAAPEERYDYRCLRDGIDMPPSQLPMQRAARDGVTVRAEEYEIVRGDGTRVWLLMHASPLLVGGELCGAVAMGVDISERKRNEHALLTADRRKDEFLATLAHELRNPLAPLRSAVHALRLGADEAAQARLLEMMERQLRHLVHLVDDLLEVSRITSGKIELRPQMLDLAQVAGSAVETAATQIAAAGHRLTLDLPPEPLRVTADPVRLAQVIANLLDNAAKYTDEGGQIRLCVRREGDQAVLRVRDTGTGIPAEMLPRVFDMFTQIDRTLGRAQGGLGIGLAVVQRLVRMHGGEVEAHSDGAGRGAEVVVRLPLADVPAADLPAAPASSAELPEALACGRILVVDDNRDAADSLALLLRAFGAEVDTAYDAGSALAAMRQRPPAVALLDLGMPGTDGCALALRVRADPALRSITLVAVTGWGQAEDRARTEAAGFDRHLVKPLALDPLLTLLRSLPRQSLRQGIAG